MLSPEAKPHIKSSNYFKAIKKKFFNKKSVAIDFESHDDITRG